MLNRLATPEHDQSLFCRQVAAQSREEALEWCTKIKDTAESASHREDENRKRERAMRIARELSNLVVYCRSVVFNLERYLALLPLPYSNTDELSIFRYTRRDERNHTEMSSFPETKGEKLMLTSPENAHMFLWYHIVQISRIYPKAQRVDSSNYNPMPFWNVGSQMLALNFQTGDRPMQVRIQCAVLIKALKVPSNFDGIQHSKQQPSENDQHFFLFMATLSPFS